MRHTWGGAVVKRHPVQGGILVAIGVPPGYDVLRVLAWRLEEALKFGHDAGATRGCLDWRDIEHLLDDLLGM